MHDRSRKKKTEIVWVRGANKCLVIIWHRGGRKENTKRYYLIPSSVFINTTLNFKQEVWITFKNIHQNVTKKRKLWHRKNSSCWKIYLHIPPSSIPKKKSTKCHSVFFPNLCIILLPILGIHFYSVLFVTMQKKNNSKCKN